jgi:hypothetical protein
VLVQSPDRPSPKAQSGSTSHPGRGCPNDPWLVGPRRTVLYRGGGGHNSWYEVHCAATKPTNNPSDRGSTGAAGSTTIAAADVLLHHPYTVPSTTLTPPSPSRCRPCHLYAEPRKPLLPRPKRWPTCRHHLPPLLMVCVHLLHFLVVVLSLCSCSVVDLDLVHVLLLIKFCT